MQIKGVGDPVVLSTYVHTYRGTRKPRNCRRIGGYLGHYPIFVISVVLNATDLEEVKC